MEAIGQSRYGALVSSPPTGRGASVESNLGSVDPHAGTLLALFTTLARTALFLDALQDECLAPFGLSFGDYAVLRLLEDPPEGMPLSPTRLAEMVVRTTGGMTKSLVKYLIDSWLVLRHGHVPRCATRQCESSG